MEIWLCGQKDRGGYIKRKSSWVASVSLTHALPRNSRKASSFTADLREGDAHASCFQGCCLHLVMFIKMAAISYLNVNYCYDTQDNLTCFGNLFFPLIRWSNWKIFQSVTTVQKVKEMVEGEGSQP